MEAPAVAEAQGKFQHTAARRRLGDIGWDDTKIVDVSTHSRPKAAGSIKPVGRKLYEWFQHTAARRRLGALIWPERWTKCFNTQPPEGGWHLGLFGFLQSFGVSTHSRPKAAGALRPTLNLPVNMFQHTAARRRLGLLAFDATQIKYVSTHSRPKAAGVFNMLFFPILWVSTHSRPKAAGGYRLLTGLGQKVSTHSRPKAAGCTETPAVRA